MDAQYAIALGTLITGLVAIATAFVKGRSAKAVRSIDVSVEWQTQMLQRIADLERRDIEKQARLDDVESEALRWRTEHRVLAEKYADLERVNENQELELAKARAQIAALDRRGSALWTELEEVYRSIGVQRAKASLPPLPRRDREEVTQRVVIGRLPKKT